MRNNTSMRPYTVVLLAGLTTRIINTSAPIEKEAARRLIQDKFPNSSVIALIPGTHATNSCVFPRRSDDLAVSGIDPFEPLIDF